MTFNPPPPTLQKKTKTKTKAKQNKIKTGLKFSKWVKRLWGAVVTIGMSRQFFSIFFVWGGCFRSSSDTSRKVEVEEVFSKNCRLTHLTRR